MNSIFRTLLIFFVASVGATSTTAAQEKHTAPCPRGHTQLALNECAADQAKGADRRLKTVYDQLIVAVGDSSRQTALATARTAWLSYREKQCAFEASQYDGGSMRPMVYYGCLASVTAGYEKQLRTALFDEHR